jgi:serine-type D-Ala-D-Ala carboxypeptidase (penicillin-binding protein 5/6)
MESYHLRYPVKGRPKRSRSFKALVVLSSLFLAMTLCAWYYFAAVTKSLPVLTAQLNQLEIIPAETIDLAWPNTGQAALGSLEEGLLATSHDDLKPQPIASIAKLVTALAILEKKPFNLPSKGDTLTLTTRDVDYYRNYLTSGGSVVLVADGEQISLYDALQALLLPSANNIADSLAVWAFGSIEEYVDFANKLVKSYGLSQTTIADASGFTSGSTSTASDLIIIGQKVLSQPVLANIVAKPNAVIPVAGNIKNTNLLLVDSGVIGLKTGTTDAAGGCLLFAAKHSFEGREVIIIGVVLGAVNANVAVNSSRSLLSSSRQGFTKRMVIKQGEILGSYKSAWQTQTDVVSQSDLAYYGWKGKRLAPIFVLSKTEAPLKASQPVAIIQLENTSLSTPVVVTSDISEPPISWRLTNFF